MIQLIITNIVVCCYQFIFKYCPSVNNIIIFTIKRNTTGYDGYRIMNFSTKITT